jgi:ferredoxin
VAAQLGAGANDLFDAGALARALPSEPASGRLDPERRGRIEASLSAIEAYLEGDDARPHPLLLHPPETPLPATAGPSLAHDDPLAAAVGCFDGLAQRGAALHRAVRTARLELAGRYRPELHDAALAQLSWEGMHADELALLPPVAVVTTGRRLRRRGQAALSELLRSSRPVHVLVLDELAVADEAADLSLFHLDLGYLVMAHREVFAVSSTLARPDAFVQGLSRMVRATRPGVALVHMAGPELASLRPLHAEAALLGRACPDFLYDPDAGPSWADRFDVDGNPQPDQAWPLQSLRGWRGDSGEGAEEQTLEASFTFADAVALEPVYQRHLLAFPPAAWDDARQLPLATWLDQLDAGSDAIAIPYIWIVDEAGRLQRAAVTRSLALASRDRLRGWHVLQELAGFENAHVERAAAAAAQAVRSEADRARAELQRDHAVAVVEARQAGAREALGQLAAALVRGDTAAALVTAKGSAPRVAVQASSLAAATPAAATTDAGAAPAAAESPVADDEPILDEPYVDSALCTTCNECTNLNGRLFAYNADKQAYIADASAGTFDDLVRAAEKCPARCIHPGRPRSGDATATPDLVTRASAFR